MSYFTIKGAVDTEVDILSPSKTSKMPRLFRDLFQNNMSPSDHRLFSQRHSLGKYLIKPEADLEAFKNIIEKSLKVVKKNREKIQDMSKKALKEKSKVKISFTRSRENDLKPKNNFLSTSIRIKPLKFRKILPRSPLDIDKSLKVVNYKSKNFLKLDYMHPLTTRRMSSDTDEDKMECNLDMYY